MRKPFHLLSLVLCVLAVLQIGSTRSSHHSDDADDSSSATPKPKHKKAATPSDDDATQQPKAKSAGTPRPKSKSTSDGDAPDSGDTPAASKSKQGTKAGGGKKAASTPKPAAEDDSSPATPSPKLKSKTKSKSTPSPGDADSDTATSDKAKSVAIPGAATPKTHFPAAVLSQSEILAFDSQPPKVQKLLAAALELTKLNLTYTYGSADPANGGMDCSGAIYYILQQQGFTDVPRDASGQYAWVRKHGQFFAVLSRKAGGFEFDDLLPGDLLFWNGTYAIDRDPPVTHSMIYLGVQHGRKQQVMWGSSDGRSFDGKQRWGVSVFDFSMPRTEAEGGTASHALFLGYAHIPGLR